MQLTDRVRWVGKIDWELRTFHGQEYSTHKGSSYNAYLVRDPGGRTALIETVWGPYAREFVDNLARVVDLSSIDYVVANHGEPDHSGALPELMRHIPRTPVYCSANGIKSLKGQYHADWDFRVMRTGDTLSLGSCELVFVEMPMLHWPDSMMCYLSGENVLFSNDAFGQHYASELMFADLVDECELWAEAIKYYANILTPFSPLVTKKIDEVLALGLAVDMICPSHGVIWRKDPLQIVQRYRQWAANYAEHQLTVVYDTMWNSTRRMAEAIAAGAVQADPTLTVKLFNSGLVDKNDIITQIFRSKVLAVGSPTVNRGVLTSVAGLLEEVEGLKFRGKKAAAFGSYGWSGESPKVLAERLAKCGFSQVGDPAREAWNPDDEGLERCRALGRQLAEAAGE